MQGYELASAISMNVINAQKQNLELGTDSWQSALAATKTVLKSSGLKGQNMKTVRQLLNEVHLNDGLGTRHRTKQELCAGAAYIIALNRGMKFNWEAALSVLRATEIKTKTVAIEFAFAVMQPIPVMEALGLARDGKLSVAFQKTLRRAEVQATEQVPVGNVEVPEKESTTPKLHQQLIGSEKDKRILELIDQGYSQVKIAQTLGCSQQNVHFHIKKLKEKGAILNKESKTAETTSTQKTPAAFVHKPVTIRKTIDLKSDKWKDPSSNAQKFLEDYGFDYKAWGEFAGIIQDAIDSHTVNQNDPNVLCAAAACTFLTRNHKRFGWASAAALMDVDSKKLRNLSERIQIELKPFPV